MLGAMHCIVRATQVAPISVDAVERSGFQTYVEKAMHSFDISFFV